MTSARRHTSNGPGSLLSLYSSEASRLRNFLRNFTTTQMAEDLTQETFFRAVEFRHLPLMHRGYLFRIARNLAIDEARRRKRAPFAMSADAYRIEVALDAPSPEEALIAKENAARAAAAIASLPEHKRRALLLFKIEGLSYREIGKLMGKSHRTVQEYVSDAIAQCHRMVMAEEDDV
nr:RNA polymerase sigma factor [Vitreimonas flagellata]